MKALRPSQPVISCWNEHNNTFSDILEPHLYSSDFSAWNAAVFAECPAGADNASLCNRGALVTEAGVFAQPVSLVRLVMDQARPGQKPFLANLTYMLRVGQGQDGSRGWLGTRAHH